MRAVSILLLLAALGLLIAQAPEQPPSGGRARTYTIRGTGLTIRPSLQQVYLHFDAGVSIESADFKLSAGSLEIDIEPMRVMELAELKLPEVPEDRERIVDDPGGAAADLARQIELPEPRFDTGALRRVAAGGGIVAQAGGVTLRTPQLVSSDGGRVWVADQRVVATRNQGGENLRLEADRLAYDIESEHAAASGNIVVRFERAGDPPVSITAQRIEYNVASGQLTVSEGLRASFGDITLSSGGASVDTRGGQVQAGAVDAQMNGVALSGGSVSADLRNQRLTASGGTRLEDSSRGLALDAQQLSVNMRTQVVEAGGGVKLLDTSRGVSVEAGRVTADLRAQKLTAAGSPVVRYGDSTFTGETIVVSQGNGRTVVEVIGEQRARINVEELSEGLGEASDGPIQP